MQKFLFSVYDSKSRVFGNPFISVNQSTALRDFNRAANDPASDLNKFPEDYTLFEIGSFDDNTGVIAVNAQAVNLGLAAQFKQEA